MTRVNDLTIPSVAPGWRQHRRRNETMETDWNIERCLPGRPWIDVRVTRDVIRGREVVTLDAIFWTRRLLISHVVD